MIKKNDRSFIAIFILYLQNSIFTGNLSDCRITIIYKTCVFMLSRVFWHDKVIKEYILLIFSSKRFLKDFTNDSQLNLPQIHVRIKNRHFYLDTNHSIWPLMIDIKNIKSRKVMTYKVKCLRNVLVFIFLINIFLNKVNKSFNKPLQNLLCAIDIQIQL